MDEREQVVLGTFKQMVQMHGILMLTEEYEVAALSKQMTELYVERHKDILTHNWDD